MRLRTRKNNQRTNGIVNAYLRSAIYRPINMFECLVYRPSKEADKPLGPEYSIFCPFANFFASLYLQITFELSSFKCKGYSCCPCARIDQGHQRGMVYNDIVILYSLMLQAKFP